MPDSAEPSSSTNTEKKDLVKRARACYKMAVDADGDNRRAAMENIKFARVPNSQWSDTDKTERGKDRLMLEFNKTKVQCKRVINEMRANRPQEKVRGYEDNDKDTAEIYEGLIRNIWNVSDGDSIADYQAEYQVYGGFGAWRITTKYSSDTAFDQDIVIENVPNPFCLWSDPAAKDMLKRDADWWIYTDKIKKSSYKKQYPNREILEFEETEFDDEQEWEEEGDDGLVRIAELWYREPTTKQLALLVTGETVDLAKEQVPPEAILRKREVKCHKIMVAIVSGDSVLEGPTEWAGSKFPWVPLYGDYLVIDGKIHWSGMVTDLKDAQRAYNSHRTAIIESVESAPKEQVWVTADQAKGHTKAWAEAHKKNWPIRVYNPDPKAPGPPIRIGGAEIPMALIQGAQIASEEINSLAGFVFDPSSLDAKNASGRALNARARQGQIATFNYPDNMGKARKLTGEILLDLIPKIYDTERSVRILGSDGAEKFKKVNQFDPVSGQVINDLSRGKFDLTVTIGPSFATQRQEAVEAYTDVAQTNPQLWGVAGDLMFKAMDLPLSEQIAERFKFILPPPIQKQLSEGKDLPPEVAQAMMQVDQAMQAVQQQGQLVEQAANEAQQEKADAEKVKSDIQVAMANLKAEEARFEAIVARSEADLQKLAADLSMREVQSEVDRADAEKVGNAVNFAIEQIQAVGQQVKSEFDQMLAQAAQVVMAAKAEAPIVIEKPRPSRIRSKRVNGEMIGQVEYDDGSVQQVKASRLNGELVGSIQN